MKVVIMAGGKGTRIRSIASDVPKPMIPLNGVPVLETEICSLREQGFKEIILTVGYLADKIIDYFGDGSQWGVTIEYFVEDSPIGNAGALFKLGLNEDFLLINGDAVFDIDFNRMLDFHKKKGALVTLLTHPNSHPYDSGLIIADKSHRVEQWLNKEDKRPLWYKNRVNAGVHILSPKVLEMSDIDANLIGTIDCEGNFVKVDLDRDILKPLCATKQMYCYDSPEYVKDMGTPERFYQVEKDFKTGKIRGKNLRNKQKAVFLDRDGTINIYKGFLTDINEFELLPNVVEAIKIINSSGYLAIVVTNQPVVARGEVSFEQLEEIHKKMETLLGAQGAYIDGIYYCPHHPHKGYEGEIPELKINCECRKPKPGMLLEAAKDFNIDLEQSWMIGDSVNDVQAGMAAGCKTALIANSCLPSSIAETNIVNSLLEFATMYIEE